MTFPRVTPERAAELKALAARDAKFTHYPVCIIPAKDVLDLLADAADCDAEIERLREAESDRDALLQAARFKPGPLAPQDQKNMILREVGGYQPAMVAARKEARKAESDALLWQCSIDEGMQEPLLLKVWKQRKAAETRADTAETELARLKEENARLREALEPFAKIGVTTRDYRTKMRQRPLRDDEDALWPFLPKVGDLRRAARALEPTGSRDDG